ncbi:hypothetical protein Tco_0031377 [Tanacetum coccineum]
MHLQKAYNTNKASFKAKHWKADPTTGTYDVEAIRRARPEEITAAEWDKYIKFLERSQEPCSKPLKIAKNRKRAWSQILGQRIPVAGFAFEMRWQASNTQGYPSLIDTFWRTHTVDGVFPKDEDRRIYSEGGMKRLEATCEYTEDENQCVGKRGKLVETYIPVWSGIAIKRATSRPNSKYSDKFKEFESGGASGSGGCGDDEESGDDEDGDGDD